MTDPTTSPGKTPTEPATGPAAAAGRAYDHLRQNVVDGVGEELQGVMDTPVRVAAASEQLAHDAGETGGALRDDGNARLSGGLKDIENGTSAGQVASGVGQVLAGGAEGLLGATAQAVAAVQEGIAHVAGGVLRGADGLLERGAEAVGLAPEVPIKDVPPAPPPSAAAPVADPPPGPSPAGATATPPQEPVREPAGGIATNPPEEPVLPPTGVGHPQPQEPVHSSSGSGNGSGDGPFFQTGHPSTSGPAVNDDGKPLQSSAPPTPASDPGIGVTVDVGKDGTIRVTTESQESVVLPDPDADGSSGTKLVETQERVVETFRPDGSSDIKAEQNQTVSVEAGDGKGGTFFEVRSSETSVASSVDGQGNEWGSSQQDTIDSFASFSASGDTVEEFSESTATEQWGSAAAPVTGGADMADLAPDDGP